MCRVFELRLRRSVLRRWGDLHPQAEVRGEQRLVLPCGSPGVDPIAAPREYVASPLVEKTQITVESVQQHREWMDTLRYPCLPFVASAARAAREIRSVKEIVEMYRPRSIAIGATGAETDGRLTVAHGRLAILRRVMRTRGRNCQRSELKLICMVNGPRSYMTLPTQLSHVIINRFDTTGRPNGATHWWLRPRLRHPTIKTKSVTLR